MAHEQKMDRYECEQCGQNFDSEQERREHMSKAHSGGKAKSATQGQGQHSGQHSGQSNQPGGQHSSQPSGQGKE
jgi:hypothetical protein